MTDPAGIDVVIEDDRWREALPDAAALAASCFKAAARLEPGVNGGVALLLTDDAGVRALNARYRDQDKPTNVLAFPAGEAALGGPLGGPVFLGDIALARETCLREASERGAPVADHAAHLIVHGLLHLIGYDHHADAEAAAMERLETAILQSLGVADPYGDDLYAGGLHSGEMEKI